MTGLRPAHESGQLRGTCLAVRDDLLPPVPRRQRDAADAAAVAQAVTATYGGTPR